MNINAGSLDESHWLNDPKKGGGRLIGEACHFIDLLRHLSGYPISQSSVISSSNYNDSLIINLKFVDGSIGVINYFVNGHKSLPKERLEIFVDNKTLFLENYQKLSGAGWKNFKKFKTWSQDKGQKNCISAFVNAIRNSESSPIPYDELVEVAQVSIDLSKQLS
jgi:predicted dehydrogenase